MFYLSVEEGFSLLQGLGAGGCRIMGSREAANLSQESASDLH